MECQKTFFLCLLYIYTFPIESFHFFGELTDLGSKLGLQRAQFWSWLTELDLYANSKSLMYRHGLMVLTWTLGIDMDSWYRHGLMVWTKAHGIDIDSC